MQVYGQVSVFEARGQYQLSVQILQTRGLGLLQAKFEALKRKLEAEGLFDSGRKRPLPKFPKRIGIVTSPSGAAVRDMLNVLQRRAPGLEILINPVRVQGIGAGTEIAVAIRELTQPHESWAPLDLVVVTRGGGSIEDLWEFNEEIVARAIFEAPIPVVSAVGHEVDFTIADFVADLRAPTPSAAAELIIPDANDLLRRLAELSGCLDRSLRNFLSQNHTRLRFLSERTLGRELIQRMRNAQQALDLATDSISRRAGRAILDARTTLAGTTQKLRAHSPARGDCRALRSDSPDLQRRFAALPSHQVEQARQRFRQVEGILRVLGPDATLHRGYSITTTENGTVIKSITQVAPGNPHQDAPSRRDVPV